MVEKKLNFNQPILSVRRYSPKIASQILDERKGSNALLVIPSLPPHRPETNSGPVRNPGSVPFLWEQIPGRPKEEILVQSHNCGNSRPSVSAELPPNETEALQKTSKSFDESSSDSADCRKEAGVDGLDLLREITDDLGATASEPRNQQQEERRKVVNQEEREGSDDGGDQDQHENVITVCCLLPRSCLKSSLCVKPVPAMRAMNRVITTFPLSGSSTDSENECAVKPIDRIQTSKLKEDDSQHELFLEEFPIKKSYKTLQELLMADEEGPKEKAIFYDDSESGNIKKSDDERNMISDSEQDWSSEEDDIRVAVNRAAENARKKQLSRAATLGSVINVPPPPPLPESPSEFLAFSHSVVHLLLRKEDIELCVCLSVQQQVLKTTGDGICGKANVRFCQRCNVMICISLRNNS